MKKIPLIYIFIAVLIVSTLYSCQKDDTDIEVSQDDNLDDDDDDQTTPPDEEQPSVEEGVYYISSSSSTNGDGLTESTPFNSLDTLALISFEPGNKILLKSGDEFEGMLALESIIGSAEKPITISTYGGEERAKIDGRDYPAALSLLNSTYFTIENLELTANGGEKDFDSRYPRYQKKSRYGLYVGEDKNSNSLNCEGVVLRNLYIHDVFYYSDGEIVNRDDVGETYTSYGLDFNYEQSYLKDILIEECEVLRVSNKGIHFSAGSTDTESYLGDGVTVRNCLVRDTGSAGIKVKLSRNILIEYCQVFRSGCPDDPRNLMAGTGIYTGNSDGTLVQYNYIEGARGDNDSRGIHMDQYSLNYVAQYNITYDNVGGFVHIVGGGRNNVFRYNISINDGYRADSGNIISFNAFDQTDNAENCYVYNNTIYTNYGDVYFRINAYTKNALIKNNLIYYTKSLTHTDASKWIDENSDVSESGLNIQFTNNMLSTTPPAPFLASENIVKDIYFASQSNIEAVIKANTWRDGSDSNPFTTADFASADSESYTGAVRITQLEADPNGLQLGYDLYEDIDGNSIDPENSPFIGAIKPTVSIATNGGSVENIGAGAHWE